MQDIFHVHPDFSKQQVAECKLSISLRPAGISFVVINSVTERIAAVYYKSLAQSLDEQEYSYELQSFFAHTLLQYSYQSVDIVYATPKITIIPASLFKKEDLHILFTFNHDLQQTEELNYYKIKNSESYLVYAMSMQIKQACIEKFGQKATMYPQSASFIETCILQNKPLQERTLFISLESTFFDALLVDANKIILYNTYEFTNVNDYMYFVMNIYEQLQLNPLTNKIILAGQISKASSYFEATKMFVRKVSLLEASPMQQQLFSYPFEDVSFPLFSHLFNLSLCE